MACGVPCVVTDVGDTARIVGDTGIVVQKRDPDALADAWERMLSMGAERRKVLGKLARKRVQENYSLDSVVRQYEKYYRQILGSDAGF